MLQVLCIIKDNKSSTSAISKQIFIETNDLLSLGKVADIYQPQTIPTSALSDNNPYPVYGANGIIGRFSKYNHETSQICIACRGNTCGTVNYSESKSWITGNAMVINTDAYNVNKRFIYHQLCNVNFAPLISGSGQPQIVRTPLERMKIWCPNLEIQSKIAETLDTLEKKRSIEISIIERLQIHKLYILSQMFI